jgi:radical SAM superfamily enzyme YgiQ (UPF0313 family)
MMVLISALRNKGIKVEFVDGVAEKFSLEDFKNRVKNSKPDVVGFTAVTEQIEDVGEMAKAVKSISKDIRIIVGGAHATALPEQTLQEFPNIDFVVYGEGIQTLPELIEAHSNYESIKGIAYRSGDKIKITPPRPYLENLDQIPFPAFNLLNLKKYKSNTHFFQKGVDLPIYSSLGCPFPCKFCHRIAGKRVRFRTPEHVIEEMAMGIQDYNATHFTFFDDTFTLNKERVIKLCNLIKQRGFDKKIKWACLSRVDTVDKELFIILKKAGCTTVYLGVESGSQYILDKLDKRIKLHEIKQTFSIAKEIGIKTVAFFMIGVPYETRETIVQTKKFISKLKPDYIELSIFTPYPGTEFYYRINQGWDEIKFKSHRWSDFNMMSSSYLIHKNFKSGELETIKWITYIKFYLHPTKFFSILSSSMFKYGIGVIIFFIKRLRGYFK